MKLRYSLAIEELLNSASELQSFRNEVRQHLSSTLTLHGCIGLGPELFGSRLEQLEKKFEGRLLAFLNEPTVLQALRKALSC